ncbi:zinc finger protein Xfin-like [Drosophila eugracilis]|uniref:zinc finger protein Xfin-like n=1 Tax=Drosophila eugracilis TaxID=29029 RepID=UPI0007E780FA|nr:zinc finger protein Xfin-like [Drosophila eugracilis]XP_017065104.1 zinc finger protein Xfin-like [Drosophila eugracilis]
MEPSICRVCLATKDNMIDIFEKTPDLGIPIASMVSLWSGYPAERDDFFPQTICPTCMGDARLAYELHQKYGKNREPRDEDTISEASSAAESVRPFVVRVKEEAPEDDITSPPKNEPLYEDMGVENYPISNSKLNSQVNEHSPKAEDHYNDNDEEEENSTGKFKNNLKSPKCPKTYKKPKQLENHLKSNKDERPYKCPLCPKDFKTSSNAKVHLRTHTGERPYTCTHCSKSFTTNSNLTRHIRSITAGKPFKCSVCSQCFKKNQSLKRHMQKHKVEPFDKVINPAETHEN